MILFCLLVFRSVTDCVSVSFWKARRIPPPSVPFHPRGGSVCGEPLNPFRVKQNGTESTSRKFAFRNIEATANRSHRVPSVYVQVFFRDCVFLIGRRDFATSKRFERKKILVKKKYCGCALFWHVMHFFTAVASVVENVFS